MAVDHLLNTCERTVIIKTEALVGYGKTQYPIGFQQDCAILQKSDNVRHMFNQIRGNDIIIVFFSSNQLCITLSRPYIIYILYV